ncbi:MAG: tetratricopeptide repeat protein, partial [Pseudomonadota bacterium]
MGKDVPTSSSVDLTSEMFGRPLYVLLAALAVVDGRSTAPGLLLDDTVAREVRLWGAENDRAFQRSACRLVGALTLRGHTFVHELAKLDQNVAGPQSDAFRDIVATLYTADPLDAANSNNDRPKIGGLEPDLLGEALILRVLCDRETDVEYLENVFHDGENEAITHGFTVLSRLSLWAPKTAATSRLPAPYAEVLRRLRNLINQRPIERALPALDAALILGARTSENPLGKWLSEALAAHASDMVAPFLAKIITARIPDSTVSLRELAVWATETQLNTLSSEPINEGMLIKRAELNRELGYWLGILGQSEDALKATKDAVQGYRQLAAQRPDAFLPDLASSLNNLGRDLNALGRREEALTSTEEAVVIYRQLAAQRPDAFLPDLAS